jgi:cyanate permease
MSLLTASLSLLTPHLWHLYLVFAGIPFLAAGASPLGYSSVLVRRFDRRLGLALGLATMGVGLGAATLPPLAQALIGVFGWRHAYAVIGLITFLVGVPSAIIATRHTRGPVLRQVGTVRLPTLPAIQTSTFLLMCTVFFLLGVTTVGVLAQLVPMMIDRGFSPAAAARVAALTGLAALVSRGGIGWVLDRVQAPRVIAVVALLACLSFLLLAYGGGRPSSYLAVLLLGGAIGAEVNFIAFLTRRHFAQALFGRLYGIGFGIYLAGGGVGPLLLGISFDHLGGYRPSLLLFTVLAATAAAVTLRIPKNEIRQA